jgi:hypothetical protein
VTAAPLEIAAINARQLPVPAVHSGSGAVRLRSSDCVSGGPDATVYALIGHETDSYRVEYELTGPLADVLRVCNARVAGDMRHRSKMEQRRGCDAAPLPRDGRVWLERVDPIQPASDVAMLSDDCATSMPEALTLTTRTLHGPFANAAQCAKEGMALGREYASQWKQALASADAHVARERAQQASDCASAESAACESARTMLRASEVERMGILAMAKVKGRCVSR